MPILEKLRNFIPVAIIYWKAMIRTAATSPPMPFLERLEIGFTSGMVYLEWMMQTIRNSIASPAEHNSISNQGRRVQHDLQPIQGLFNLTYGNFVLAGANLFTLLLWGTGHFTPKQLFVHSVYAVLAEYCATTEVYDMTIGGVGDRFFPFESFPFIMSVVILALLFLEVIWNLFKASLPISSIAVAVGDETIEVVIHKEASISNSPPANIIPNAAAAAAGTVRHRERGSSSSGGSNSNSSTDAAIKTEGSTGSAPAAKTKGENGKNKTKAV